ncbi:MAG TPA: thiamine pyrophosphate-binding protein [Baekduia sp.]
MPLSPPAPTDARNGDHPHATVADTMVATLRASGVRRVYGLPGDALDGFTDAIRRHGEVAWEHVRHEESAAFAAAGEAAMTGELAVCAAGCGPGGVRLVNGLFDASRSGVPVLAITAQIPRAEIGGGYVQETHSQELFRECSVYAELVSVPEQLPRVLEIAMRHSLERRGVAVVVVPGEVFRHRAGDAARVRAIRPAAALVRPDDASLLAAADLLNAGTRVTILAGAGCRGAHDELVALAERLKAPIVHTLRGKEWVEHDNPYDVGMTGPLGFASGYRAMEHCDVLLMLGTDFPYRPFLPEGARIIQVDRRGERIGRRAAADVPLVGTVKDTIDALLPRLVGGRDAAHLDQMVQHYRVARERCDREAAARHQADGPIHPRALTAAIDRVAAYDAVLLPDAGTPTLWAARRLTMNGRRRLIGPFHHGAMASAVPQALGVQAAHPGRQVVALAGDGGLGLLLGELLTLGERQLPVKVVVYNDGASGSVASFAAIARAIGLHAVRIDHAADLDSGLRAAFDAPGPALVEVVTARQEPSFPPHGSRGILSGYGDEVVDVAPTTLAQLAAEGTPELDRRGGVS